MKSWKKLGKEILIKYLERDDDARAGLFRLVEMKESSLLLDQIRLSDRSERCGDHTSYTITSSPTYHIWGIGIGLRYVSFEGDESLLSAIARCTAKHIGHVYYDSPVMVLECMTIECSDFEEKHETWGCYFLAQKQEKDIQSLIFEELCRIDREEQKVA